MLIKTTHTQKQNGFTLVEFLVAMAISILVIQGALKVFNNSAKEMTLASNKAQLEDLRNYIRDSLDCEKTLLAIPNGELCDVNYAPFSARDRSGKEIKTYKIASFGSASHFNVRSICTNIAGKYPPDLNVEYQIQTESPTPIFGPWSVTESLANPEPVLREPLYCGSVKSLPPLGPCKFADTGSLCPAGTAASGMISPLSGAAVPPLAGAPLTCCPVPVDLLTGNSSSEISECPADSVLTGSMKDSGSGNVSLRCTKINTVRYFLGSETKGVWYSFPGCAGLPGQGSAAGLSWDALPMGLKVNTGRLQNVSSHDTQAAFADSVCVPDPGALMTRRDTKFCGDMYAKKIYDRLTGKEVKMFPNSCTVEMLSYTNSGDGSFVVTSKNMICTDRPAFWK